MLLCGRHLYISYGPSLWSFPPGSEGAPLRVLLERLERAGDVLVADVHQVEDLPDLLLGVGDDVLEEDGVMVDPLVLLVIRDLKMRIVCDYSIRVIIVINCLKSGLG